MTLTYLIQPHYKQAKLRETRDAEAMLEEGVGLTYAIDLNVTGSAIVTIAEVKPSTLMGKGKVEELAGYIEQAEAELVIVNDSLSPVQQRNLEKAWGVKVIDRTALILEIFGARARTHEGKLQVELAALNYQKSRLVRSWTHLERQRGGFGFMGGPGESQIEIDRRLISDRITKIKKQLTQVQRTRELHRKVRRDTPYPVVALVGYTNAGKSTLFNRLTGASVMAMDKLFATLDPTMRAVQLASGQKIILSDTVGFVSNLPTELVAAFRATLEEVLEADILLHVRDISHPDSEAQKEDVETVLTSLFDSEQLPDNVLEVYNKADQLEAESKAALAAQGHIVISALTGEGVEELTKQLSDKLLHLGSTKISLTVPAENGKMLAWLHAHGKVMNQRLVNNDQSIAMEVWLSDVNRARFHQQFYG